jgi:hypothetical protein
VKVRCRVALRSIFQELSSVGQINASASVALASRCDFNCEEGFLPAIAPDSPVPGKTTGVLQMARWWNVAPDLPDVSKCFRRIAHARDHRANLHGVVFNILVGSESRVGRWASAGAERDRD